MMDLITNTMIADWSHDVMCGEGDWRDRLQSLTGKLLIKAQHRPFCARCNAPLRVKTNKENSRQFFGCRNYQGGRGCRYTKDLDLAFEPNPRTASEANSGDQQSNANTDGFLKAGGPSAYTARQQQPPQQDRSQQQQP